MEESKMSKSDFIRSFRVYSSNILQSMWDKTQKEIVEKFEKENPELSNEMDAYISLASKMKALGTTRYSFTVHKKLELIGMETYYAHQSNWISDKTKKWSDSQREEYKKVLVAFERVANQLDRCKSDKQCRTLLTDYGLEHILPSVKQKQIAPPSIVDAETVAVLSKLEKIVVNNTILIENE